MKTGRFLLLAALVASLFLFLMFGGDPTGIALYFFSAVLMFTWFRAMEEGGYTGSPGYTVPKLAIIAGGMVPPLLFSMVALSGLNRYGDIRINLEALRFDLENIRDTPLTLGGGDDDDIHVKGIPEKYLEFRSTGNTVKVSISKEKAGNAAVRLGGETSFHNAVAMDGNPAILVYPKDGMDQEVLRYVPVVGPSVLSFTKSKQPVLRLPGGDPVEDNPIPPPGVGAAPVRLWNRKLFVFHSGTSGVLKSRSTP